MKFIKIQDGIIIKKESLESWRQQKFDKSACHYYIAKYNQRTKAYDMYPTSHYVDPKKATDVKKGRAILMKLNGKELSTVYKIPRTKDVNGQYFKDTFSHYETVGKLTKAQQKRFETFLSKRKGR